MYSADFPQFVAACAILFSVVIRWIRSGASWDAVLEGRADHVTLNGIDRWIGGVHLTPDNLWRFDPETKALLRG